MHSVVLLEQAFSYKTHNITIIITLLLLTDLVILELGGLHPGAAEAALHQPGGALLGHVLLVLGPGDRLVAGLAQGDVAGAVDHVQLVAGLGDTAPAEISSGDQFLEL